MVTDNLVSSLSNNFWCNVCVLLPKGLPAWAISKKTLLVTVGPDILDAMEENKRKEERAEYDDMAGS